MLTSLGYEVIVAKNGEEAIDLFDANREKIDLLLFDVVMPITGGIKAYETIVGNNGSRPPVVFMTGYSADVAPHALGTDTGCRVLCKPYDLDALAGVVREVLEGAGV